MTGWPIEEYPRILAALRGRLRGFPLALAGLELALWRASLAEAGISEHAWWGGRRSQIETDVTVPFLPSPGSLEAWMAHVARAGFRAYKVKTSGDPEADLAFVGRVRRLLAELGKPFTIRLDGNQGYTARSYLRMLRGLGRERIAIELFEQPLRRDDWAGMRRVRGATPAPLVLDEAVFTADDCRRVAEEKLADGVNVKLAKSGVAEAEEILRVARAAGLKRMIGCMTETFVGLSAGILFAAGTGGFDYVDLDSVHFLRRRGRWPGIAVRGPRYLLSKGPRR